MSFRKLTFDALAKELDKYKFKQLHIHHTWKPAKSSFKGNNHTPMQQSMKNYHVNTNKWSDIAQHLTLFPDGVWLTGRPFNKTPASISGWNTGALCVEMIGNFDLPGTLPYNNLGYDKLEGVQKQEILKLIKYFIDKYGEQSVKFHNDHPNVSKTCPGTSLNKQVLIQEAKNMNSKPIAPQPQVNNNIPSAWAKSDWEWGILNGLVDGTNPKGNLSREQLMAVISRYHKKVKSGELK